MGVSLKPSQFNYFCADPDGNLILHNTFRSNFCKISKQYASQMIKILDKEDAIPDNISSYFFENGFFVKADSDELAVYKSKCFEYYDIPILDLSVLTTHQCNCRCVYCYEDFNDGFLSEENQNALLKFIKDKLPFCSSLHIDWFGGEPLVGIHVIRNLSPKLIALCKSMHKPYSASITTNGTLLTCEMLTELQGYNIVSYQLTLDGTKDVHDLQRPLAGEGSSYDLIIHNLEEIKKKKVAKSFIIKLRINLTKKSMPILKEYLIELNTIIGGDSRFELIFNLAYNWGGDRIDTFNENLFDPSSDMKEVRNIIYNIIRENNLSLKIMGLGGNFSFDLPGSTKGCYVNKKNFYTVDSTGFIFKCAQEIRNNYPPLANLQTYKGLDDIKKEQAKWDSVIFPDYPEKCKKCAFLPRGCWGIAKCPVIKYAIKYNNGGAGKNPCLDNSENIKIDLTDSNGAVCPSFINNIDKILNHIAKEHNLIFIENIYID